MDTILVEETIVDSDAVDRFFADTVDNYMAEEEIVLSEDAESGAEFALTDRSNNCFEEFMELGEGSEAGTGLRNAADGAHDPLSKLLAESGLQYYSPPAAGPSTEEELRMMALLESTEPESAEETSHFVRRSLRKRSVRLEDLVDEDSDDESPPRRKGGRNKARRSRKNSRRPRSQPRDEWPGPSLHHQQQQQLPVLQGPQQHQQQFLHQQTQFPREQQSEEPQQQQLFQQQVPQQHQFAQQQLSQASQQFPQQQQPQVAQQHQQLAQQTTQQQPQHQFSQLPQPQVPQQQHQIHQEQQQQTAPPPPPHQLHSTLPATAVMDRNEMLLSSWNNFMFNYISRLPKDKLRYLDSRLNDRLLGRLPPIQR
ncbi:mediator of RNA polymerase II transcription subunit 15-like [Schistocerca americana]|uniref:mediator of RNA polymerase II transcription subunit 15-like n=1 Tax=Schistocerca americana TaxID=7009 RepID=UPI001F4F349D|nr:mediator of RNA polymerase II transcription subunit 15-like [Schistocerca americana]